MTEFPKQDLGAIYEVIGWEEKRNSIFRENSVSDNMVIDMDCFSDDTNIENLSEDSRIHLQKSFSRKGFQRGGEKKVGPYNDRDSSSPRGNSVGSAAVEKAGVVAVGPTDDSINPKFHHQITIKTSSISTTATTQESFSRRNSFRWASPNLRFLDPRRIMLIFATLSSFGTMLLIYFTLSISKLNLDENGFD